MSGCFGKLLQLQCPGLQGLGFETGGEDLPNAYRHVPMMPRTFMDVHCGLLGPCSEQEHVSPLLWAPVWLAASSHEL